MKLKKLKWVTVIWTENGIANDALKADHTMGMPAIYLMPKNNRRAVRFYTSKNSYDESIPMTLKKAKEHAQEKMQRYYDDMKAKIEQIEKEIGGKNETVCRSNV